MANINVRVLQIALAEKEMSYTELSKKTGLSRQAISTIVKRGTCSPVNAGKLAQALELNPAELIG